MRITDKLLELALARLGEKIAALRPETRTSIIQNTMQFIGSQKSKKKAASSARNGKLGGIDSPYGYESCTHVSAKGKKWKSHRFSLKTGECPCGVRAKPSHLTVMRKKQKMAPKKQHS